MNRRFLKVVYIILLSFLSIIFVFAGMDKILNRGDMFLLFRDLGLPRSVTALTGFSEIVLACLLHVRYFTKLALQALMFILIIGLLITLSDKQYLYSVFSMGMLILTFVTHTVGTMIFTRRNTND